MGITQRSLASRLRDPETERKLAKVRGEELTGKQLKEMFGYSPNTYIRDTFLYHAGLIEQLSDTSPTLWRVQSDLPVITSKSDGKGRRTRGVTRVDKTDQKRTKQMSDMKADVSQQVRQLRALKGWTQSELARQIPVSLPTVQRWEAGRPVRGLAVQQMLARLFEEAGIGETVAPSVENGEQT